MNLLILDQNFETIDFADEYESRIWTDRYCGFGDFEIYTPVSIRGLQTLLPDSYIWSKDSEHLMVIEDVVITSDVELGSRLKVTGRSLESILERRIIWAQTILTGNFQNGIQQLLNENVISPVDPDRQISNFIFIPSTDPAITGLTIEAQFYGENLYDAMVALCAEKDLGFKVTLSDTNQLVFELYAGADRSYDQFLNPYVIFSQKFENLANSNYIESTRPKRTVSLVGGEGEGTARKTTVVGSGADLERREVFTDASSVSSSVDGGTLTPEEYTAQLEQKGLEVLASAVAIKSFEGQAETTLVFRYGRDFFMGDIVQIVNEYGLESRTRVTEFIQSHSLTGMESYPTFSTIQ